MKLSDSKKKFLFSKAWGGTLLLVPRHFVSLKKKTCPCRGMPVPCACIHTSCTPFYSSVHNPDPASSAPAACSALEIERA
jgi:hypothetical protein